jgi:acid phosphatase (class A)
MKQGKFLIFVFAFGFASTASAVELNFFHLQVSPPPVTGSAAYQADFNELHFLQDHRTPAECKTADAESSLNLEDAFGPATGVLTEAEIQSVHSMSAKILSAGTLVVIYYKRKFHRPRPYVEDPTLTPCIQIPTGDPWSYPSGHSTAGYLLALALAQKFPAKKDLILQQGLQIGENRLIGGVHHPSDVMAGRELATELMKSAWGKSLIESKNDSR